MHSPPHAAPFRYPDTGMLRTLKQAASLHKGRRVHVLVSRDRDGRDLKVGDPVTLYYGGIANRRHLGQKSRGNVTGFGTTNVQVRLTDSRHENLIGTTVPVPGAHLKYGHIGYVRAADELADIEREYNAELEKAKRGRAEDVLSAVIKLATERGIITRDQGQELWMLQNEIPQPAAE